MNFVNMLSNNYVPRASRGGRSTKKNKRNNVFQTFYTPVGKSVRLVKNVAGTGTNLALTIPKKVLKKAGKTTRKMVVRAAKNMNRVGQNVINSLSKTFTRSLKSLVRK
jgi:hypothetical protein